MNTETIQSIDCVKTGRKPLNIDWDRVDTMLEAHCTAVSIADVLGVSESALRKRCEVDKKVRFSEYAQLKRAKGDDLLRDKQYQVAMSGDKVMLVWLGKNRLGQSDKKEIEHITTDHLTHAVPLTVASCSSWQSYSPRRSL